MEYPPEMNKHATCGQKSSCSAYLEPCEDNPGKLWYGLLWRKKGLMFEVNLPATASRTHSLQLYFPKEQTNAACLIPACTCFEPPVQCACTLCTHISFVGHVKLLRVTAPAVESSLFGSDLEASCVAHESAVERLVCHDGAAYLISS